MHMAGAVCLDRPRSLPWRPAVVGDLPFALDLGSPDLDETQDSDEADSADDVAEAGHAERLEPGEITERGVRLEGAEHLQAHDDGVVEAAGSQEEGSRDGSEDAAALG